MSLQFILGSSGAGKSYAIYQKIIAESIKFPENNYLVIVPEQFTMQTQKQLVDMHPAHGIMNIDVLSFARLAYRIFAEVGSDCPPILEETGKSFVLQKIAQEKSSQLRTLGSNMKKSGYINEMKSMISELMQYRIAPKDIDRMIEKADEKQMLKHKLADIKVIFGGFVDYLQDCSITPEEVLEVASTMITQSDILKGSTIILDGFTGFTPVQYQLIRELLRSCSQVYVTATIDKKDYSYQQASYHHLFHMSREMMQKLGTLASDSDVSVDSPLWVAHTDKGRFATNKAMQFLEQNLFRHNAQAYHEEQSNINITAMENPQAESEVVVGQICQLLREHNLRYKDIAIITGDLEKYKELLRPILEKEKIPFFIDETHSILLNPFVEYLRSAMDMVVANFSYESVFRYLRSGMTSIAMTDVDMLENYVIALGIRGRSKWSEPWVRHYRGMKQEKVVAINAIREQFIAETKEFADSFGARNQTVEQRTRSLYQFILQGNIQEKLKSHEEYFEAAGDVALVKEYAQIYGIIMNLLDKLVEVLGSEKITVSDYQQVLEAGFWEAQVGIIPPSADQLVIGDVKRTRLGNIKALFLVGVNEGIIPQQSGQGGILSELEREFLKGHGEELSPGARENMYIQRFYLYQNLTKPSRYLYLSYAKSTTAGESSVPAYLVFMFKKLFPQLQVREVSSSNLDLAAIKTIEQGISALPDILRNLAAGQEDEAGLQLLEWFIGNEEYQDMAKQLLEAAFYENNNDAISKSVARTLYGDVLENSATRLEKFSACAFAHFLEYGLGLRRRVQYEFSDMDMGNVMHEALEKFAQKLQAERLDLKDVQDDKRDTFIAASVDEIMADYGNTIAQSSARNQYMVKRIKRIMQRTAWALQEQAKRGDFTAGGIEISFAMEDELAAINFNLSDEATMRLRGRIDRIDVCETDDTVYVKVIDYKSGKKTLDLIELYHGLQLQLIVYLNAAVEIEQNKHDEKQVKPAGIFYYTIEDPLVEGDSGEDSQQLQERILKDLRMSGLVSDSKEAVCHLDNTLDAKDNKSSNVIPVSLNQNGSYSKSSKVVSEEQMTILSKYVHDKLGEIGTRITQGDVAINPYELGSKQACTYCDYRSVCGFDERVKGCQYRRLRTLDEEIIWQQMNREDEDAI